MKYEIRIHDKLVATVHQELYLIDIIKATGSKINDVVEISLQAAAVQSVTKPIDPGHLYPHMQYGLPKYYAVMFDKFNSEGERTEAIKRFNKIHNSVWNGKFKFYGFDGLVNCWADVASFARGVTVFTAREFLELTDKYFNPIAPESNPIDPDHLYPHIQYGLPKYYAVMIDDKNRALWESEGIDRHNKIHNVTYYGNLNFYGFDEKSKGSDTINSFKESVALLSVDEFMHVTDFHFKPEIPDLNSIPVDKFPHMKYGLPKYYAVMFGDVRTHPLDIEALKRYNKIHTTAWVAYFRFCGFDGKAHGWDNITSFVKILKVLSVTEFLKLTNEHFNPIAPEPNPIYADRYPHMLLGLPKYYAVILDQVEYPQARRVFNQIHHVNYGCNVKYCGFDGANFNNGTRAVNDVAQFNVKLDVLTAAEFLTAANKHFNPTQK